MKKLREKGITLVALVVTIIILLILAGVALRLALSENGLFKMASQSGEIARDVSEEEKVKLAVSGAFLEGTGTLTKANVEKALEKEFGELEEGQLSGEEKGPWTFTGKRKTYEISGGGDIEELKEKTVADLVAGDWVTYESAKGPLKCRVLYDTAYNTTNETDYGVQIISATNIKEITLGSGTNLSLALSSYNSAIETLNKEARSYINTENNYALEARCVGSDPRNPDQEGTEQTHSAQGNKCSFDGQKIKEKYETDYDVKQLEILYQKMTDADVELGEFWLAARCDQDNAFYGLRMYELR